MKYRFVSLCVTLMLFFGASYASDNGKTFDLIIGGASFDEDIGDGDDQTQMYGVAMNLPLSDRWNVEVRFDRSTLGKVSDGHAFAYNVPISLQFGLVPGNRKFDFYVGGGAGPQQTEGLELEVVDTVQVINLGNPSNPTAANTISEVETTEMVDADQTSFNWHVELGGALFFNDARNFGLEFGVRQTTPFDEDSEEQQRVEYVVALKLPFPNGG